MRLRCCAVRGGTQRGSREDEDARRKDRRRKRSARRGPQRAHRVLAAGALAVFSADPPAAIYKRAAGALAVSAVDPQSTIYKNSVGALVVFTADPPSSIYTDLLKPSEVDSFTPQIAQYRRPPERFPEFTGWRSRYISIFSQIRHLIGSGQIAVKQTQQ